MLCLSDQRARVYSCLICDVSGSTTVINTSSKITTGAQATIKITDWPHRTTNHRHIIISSTPATDGDISSINSSSGTLLHLVGGRTDHMTGQVVVEGPSLGMTTVPGAHQVQVNEYCCWHWYSSNMYKLPTSHNSMAIGPAAHFRGDNNTIHTSDSISFWYSSHVSVIQIPAYPMPILSWQLPCVLAQQSAGPATTSFGLAAKPQLLLCLSCSKATVR